VTEIRTSCFRNYRPSMGQPVVIALRTPKWMPQAEQWPKVGRLMPKWSYFNADDATFEREYIAQLERYGVASIRQRLEQVAAETGAQTLVLLCHEADGDAPSCHRGMFRDWAARHGWEISEAEGGKPSLKGEFRTHDADGRQLVVADGRWTYAWSGQPPLAVGDRIVVPFGKQQKGMTVTALGTDYAGTAREVEGRQEELQ
jgi:hypothetical protein